MGLIKNIIVDTAKGVAKDVAKDGIIKARDAIEQQQLKNTSKFLKNAKKGSSHLVIFADKGKLAKNYDVFDESECVKYKVSGKILALKHNINIYDKHDQLLGNVKEELITIKNPFAFESSATDFIITISGVQTGEVRIAQKVLKWNVELYYKGWKIDGDIFARNYNIMSDDKILMKVTNKLSLKGNMYYLEFPENECELDCLLILIAIDAAHESKMSMTLKK